MRFTRPGWEGVWQLDQFPFREDPVQAAKDGVETMRGLPPGTAAGSTTRRLRAAQDAQDALLAQRIAKKALYSALAEMDGASGERPDSVAATLRGRRGRRPLHRGDGGAPRVCRRPSWRLC